MIIATQSWHARAYQNWHYRKYGREATKTNLCSYCRVVMLWSWIRPLFIDGFIGTGRNKVPLALLSWGSIALFLEYELLKHFGWKMLKFQGLFVLAVIAAVLVILTFAGVALINESKPVKSFKQVLIARVDAWHEGICPFITFKD